MKNFINSLVDNGNVQFVTPNGKSAKHRAKRRFEVGCDIRIPDGAPLLAVELPENGCFPGHLHPAYAFPVEVTFSDGEKQFDLLFLGTLTKSVFSQGSLVRTQGAVPEFMDTCHTLDEQLAGLRGRDILVTDIREVTDFRGHTHRVCSFDFI